MTVDKQDEAARRYIDRIREITARYGLGAPMTTETYEKAVKEAKRTVAPLASRARAAARK
jgi:hypothetical protein